VGSDHHLVVVQFKLKLAATKKKKNLRRRYYIRNLKFEDKRREFQLTLQNRFELLDPSLGEDERDVNKDWKNIRGVYMYIEHVKKFWEKWKGTERSGSRTILGGRLRKGDN